MPARLLIAEDSRTQREVLRMRLENAGYAVVPAADGEQALELLQQGGVDMLISDVVMPGMDGYALCQQAKAFDGQLPVVLLTAMTDPLDVVHGLQAGADNFLRKPYAFPHLRRRIQIMLQNKQLRSNGEAAAGLELFILGQRFEITSERQQILDMLVSTFEDLVGSVQQLRQQEAELAVAGERLAGQLAEAQAQRERLAAVLRAVPQPVVVVDADGRVTGASDAMAVLVGARTTDELRNRFPVEFLRLTDHTGQEVPREQRPLTRALREGSEVHAGRAFDMLVERADGKRVPVQLYAAPVLDDEGRTTGAVETVHELEALSLHDPLTRLPGHTFFAQHVDRAVHALNGGSEVAAVLVLVVDRSADLRNSLGKERTDRLTQVLADRLREAVALPTVRAHSPSSFAGYLGDMEFSIVLPSLAGESHGVLVAEAVRQHLGGQHRLDDLDLIVTVTGGLSTTAEAGNRAEKLVPAAAAAAHLGSRSGGNRVQSFSPGALESAADRLRAQAALRHAIENGELRVQYQPIVSLEEERVVGVEALVRWQHPERGLQPPSEFIPMAEESGLIVPLGWEVLRQSCVQMGRWRTELSGAGDLCVSVNLSPQQLVQGDIAQRVEAALTASGLAPRALSLEITEAGVVTDMAAATVQLQRLRAMGVGISVDDFGTGYSSLLQLRTLPVDTLKVDREFVDGLMTDPDDAVIVSASVSLALALRLRVVAEGVETEEQAEELRRLGCDCGQGYLWSRPLAPEDFEQWWGAARPGLRSRVRPGVS